MFRPHGLPLGIGLTGFVLATSAMTALWQCAERAEAESARGAQIQSIETAAEHGARRVEQALQNAAREVELAAAKHAFRIRDYWYQREPNAPLNELAAGLTVGHDAVNVIVDRDGRVIAASGAASTAQHVAWFDSTPTAGRAWWAGGHANTWVPVKLDASRSDSRSRHLNAISLVRPIHDADGSVIAWWRHLRPIADLSAGVHARDGVVALIGADGTEYARLGGSELVGQAMPEDVWRSEVATDESAGTSAVTHAVALDRTVLAGGWQVAAARTADVNESYWAGTGIVAGAAVLSRTI